MATDLDREFYSIASARLQSLLPGCGVPRRVTDKQFRWSDHLVLAVTQEGRQERAILVKRIREQDGLGRRQMNVRPNVRARDEYRALSTIAGIVNRRQHPRLLAVEPVACFDDLGVVAMSYHPGRDYLKRAGQAARPFATRRELDGACEYAQLAGEWLALLHRNVPGHDMVQAPSVLADIELQLAEDGEQRQSWRHAVLTIMRDLHQHTVSPIGAVLQHGDFYPDNIVISEDRRLYVVDTTLNREGSAANDVAKFMVGITTMKGRVLGWPVSAKRLELINAAFLAGYEQHAPVAPWWLVAALLKAMMVRRAELRAVAAGWGPGPAVALLKLRIDRFMAIRVRSLSGILSGNSRLPQ
jgi:hypothetical protein